MFKQVMIGAASALTIAGASLFVATQAQAAASGAYVNARYDRPPPPDSSGCWRWSYRSQQWYWVCQQPYYDQPYYSQPAPFFGFSFGGGDREFRGGDHHDEGGRGGDHHDEGGGGGDRRDHRH